MTLINYDNTIKKSNELSMAKMNQGLTLNQMQLLAFAIYCTQKDGKTKLVRKDFKDKFNIEYYHINDAYEDSARLSTLQFNLKNLENDKFNFVNVFRSIYYEDGIFILKWNDDIIPHILELKEKYVLTDLTITANFKSSFSWILYEYLKAFYGYTNKELSKGELLKLFSVENRKTYQKNTNRFKHVVLDVAIDEINKYTELNVRYDEVKSGNKIVGFKIYWSRENIENGATDKQFSFIESINQAVQKNTNKYLSIKNTDDLKSARTNYMKINELIEQVDDTLTSDKAKDIIWELNMLYKQLEVLVKKDKKGRDTSVYFNWLKGEEEQEDTNT